MPTTPQKINKEKQQQVLTTALLKMAGYYNLSRKDLCDIVGFSEATASRIFAKEKLIDPNSKEGEIALLLLRIYRSLNAIVGDNDEKASLWLRSDNNYFKTKPLEHMRHIEGLVDVVRYLDGMRGKI